METLHSDFSIKSLNTNDGTFSGYGSVFGNIDSHGDIVAKGAFKESIKEAKATGEWPAMLLLHGTDDQLPIGIWTNLTEDDYGLHVEGKLAFTSLGRDVYALMKMQPRPALNGLSIGYRAQQFVMHGRASKARRTLQSVKLVEVSLVCSPSNTLATVRRVKSIRSPYLQKIARSTDDAASNFMRALASLQATTH